jgi:bifunctional DNA-binding transcriptional regulator/antitoxin component of YhaV-PrlF toxin-antitoxin module
METNATTQIKISKGQITIPEPLREQYELHDVLVLGIWNF